MRQHINRLPATAPKGFAGSEIHRAQSLAFRLDGRTYSALAGDTVLTALLASGVDTLGTHHGQPIGLRLGAAPAIAHRQGTGGTAAALPMDRTPVRDGDEFVTLASARRLGKMARLFQQGRSLGLNLDRSAPNAFRPWRTLPGTRQAAGDMVVIGGGVAGMSAALTAAHAGLAVTLVEASAALGGHAGLFGTQDEEDATTDEIAQLIADVHANAAITVLTHADAFALTTGVVRVHHVQTDKAKTVGQVLDLAARFIVIATGATERLPVIPGNRRPGVVSASEAYWLARRYGIWLGQSFMVSTSANPAYRLATLASDAGKELSRIADGRDQANSRFIEFCKAYGFRLFAGTVPTAIGREDGRLSIDMPQGEPVVVDRLILSGGWQPDLTLWHMAGGKSAWSGAPQRLEPQGTLEAIALAGAAAGYLTRRGCIASGKAAIAALTGQTIPAVDDPVISALHETPDKLMVAVDLPEGREIAYLDAEDTLATRPEPLRRSWMRAIFEGANPASTPLADAPQSISVSAVSAGVALGLIPPDSAGVIAEERVALIPLHGTEEQAPFAATEPQPIPAYLHGRFGPDAVLKTVTPADKRRIESGALIFAGHDTTEPGLAVGVVLRMSKAGIEVLLASDLARPGTKLIVRDVGQTLPVEVGN